MRWRNRFVTCAAFAILTHTAIAQEFSVRASRRAVVRAQPSTDAADLERLDAGDERVCVTDGSGGPRQVDGFYEIRTSTAAVGFVSRYTVRVHRGRPENGGGDGATTTADATAAAESRHTVAEIRAFRQEHSGRFGLPIGQTELVGEGFVIGYDPRLKIPAWVQWRLTRDDIGGRDREESFRVDGRVQPHQQSTEEDYDQAGVRSIWQALGMTRDGQTESNANTANFYARGHLVPDRSQGRTAALQRDTYVLTNMAPQVQHGFNGGTWRSLEDRIRGWCESRGPLTIIAGPIFSPTPRLVSPEATGPERRAILENGHEPTVKAQPPTQRQVIYNVLGTHLVAVPSAFFCIVLDDRDSDNIAVLAFIIDNASVTVAQGRDLDSTLTSVATIQRRTGLDLLSALPDDVETALEAETATAIWR